MSRTNRIESITLEQKARFPEFIDRWTRIGLSTAPADRRKAEAAITRLYGYKRLALPRFAWCGSPLSQSLTRGVVASLPKSLASVRASVGASVYDSGFGQYDAGWLSFYSFFREACMLSANTDPLVPLFDLAESAGWWLPHPNICWISERHNVLNRDERGRLHCPTAPAMAYPDGWEIYAWHGVRVPRRVIVEHEKITAKEILGEQNVEIRRVMMKRVGYERFLREAGAKPIDSAIQRVPPGSWEGYSGEPVINELLVMDLPPDEPEHLLKAVKCVCPSTGRVYVERVPPNVSTLLEAQAWQFNVKPSEYKILAES